MKDGSQDRLALAWGSELELWECFYDFHFRSTSKDAQSNERGLAGLEPIHGCLRRKL